MEREELLVSKLKELGEVEIIGKTYLGRNIPLVKIGKNAKVLLIASVHAREHITSTLLNALVSEKSEIDGCNFDYLPYANLDGVLLAKYGLDTVKDENARKQLLNINKGSEDFSLWKANARGVDINVNFDADWGEGRYNLTYPSSANYIGKDANSEEETRAIVELLKRNYALIVCYHSLGEEVYWGYESNFRHYEEAKEYADYVGYKLRRIEDSTGGIKDYYSLNYSGLGLTVEIGEEKYGHPYPEDKLDLLINKHKGSIRLLCKLGERISGRINATCY